MRREPVDLAVIAGGVGLGLAIVQAIANAHDAVVNAETRTGGGLRIEIGFPAAALSRRTGANYRLAGAGAEVLEDAAPARRREPSPNASASTTAARQPAAPTPSDARGPNT